MVDFLGRHEFATGLPHFHEVDVVLEEGSVEDALDSELVANVSDGEHVLKGYRLASDEVGSGFDPDERHFLRSEFLDGLAEKFEVEVALERVVALGDETLLVDEFDDLTSEAGYVGLRRCEVEVHKGIHPGLHVSLGEDVLGGSSLMGGKDVVGAEDFLHGGLDPVEGLAAGVGIIRYAH